MSDPVTNVEIEDVLSSIRRLVTEDNRPTETPPQAQPETHETSEKLVLTPAFRVEEPAAKHDEPVEQTADVTPENAEPVTQETRAEWSESASTQPEDIADDFGDHRDTDWIVEDAPETVPQTNDLETKIAALEAAVGAQVDEDWEEETGEESPEELNSDANWEDVEAAFGQKDTMPEPELVEPAVEDAEVDVAQFVHTEPQDTVQDVQSDQAPQMGAASDDTFDGLETESEYVDEEALRDLVLEIVREELQGAMGERITRNVRKLVRREIHRILSSQDLG